MQAVGPSVPGDRQRSGYFRRLRQYYSHNAASYMNDLWVFDTELMTWRMIVTGGDEQLKRSNFSMNYDPVNDRYHLPTN